MCVCVHKGKQNLERLPLGVIRVNRINRVSTEAAVLWDTRHQAKPAVTDARGHHTASGSHKFKARHIIKNENKSLV